MTKEAYLNLVTKVSNHKALVTFLSIADKFLVLYAVLAYMGFLFVSIYAGAPNAISYLLVPAISFVLVSVFRHVYNAKRPYEIMDFEPLIGKGKKGQSFPSRHVFSIVIIGITFLQVNILLGIITLVAAVFLAIIRVICGVHFIKDVVAGTLIAVLCGILGYVVLL